LEDEVPLPSEEEEDVLLLSEKEEEVPLPWEEEQTLLPLEEVKLL
jgi:hypothetical protein